MKPVLLLALALAALLAGPWPGPAGEPARHAGAGRLEDTPRPASPTASTAIHPQEPRSGPPAASAQQRLAAAHPATAGPPDDAAPGLAAAASSDADWRDSALALLSQIGVLCPAAGCDSLEDD